MDAAGRAGGDHLRGAVPIISSPQVGAELIYQLAGLGLAGVVLAITFALAPTDSVAAAARAGI